VNRLAVSMNSASCSLCTGSGSWTRIANRLARGSDSRAISTAFVAMPVCRTTPVTLPPGRRRLATNPCSTGDEAVAKTIGISEVAFLHASIPPELAVRITAGLSATRSIARPGSLSSLFSAHRASIRRLRPSAYPSRFSSDRKAVIRERNIDSVPGNTTPTIRRPARLCPKRREETSARQAPLAPRNVRLVRSGALVQPRQHELAVPERFRGSQPAVRGAEHALEQLVAGLVRRELPPQQSLHIELDVLGHRAHGARIRAQLDHRKDRVTDHVALPGREKMHCVARRGAQRHHLGRGRGRIHEP